VIAQLSFTSRGCGGNKVVCDVEVLAESYRASSNSSGVVTERTVVGIDGDKVRNSGAADDSW
jgi:hypothetical protein